MRRIAPLLISALYLATAVAQDDAPEEELPIEELRRYTVEVIVFSYEEDVSIGSEIFLPDEVPVEEEPLTDVEGGLLVEDEEPVTVSDKADDEFEVEEPLTWSVAYSEGIDEDTGPEDNKLKLVLLDEEDFVLSDAIRQFELLDAYATIMHVGWTQPVYPLEETPAIELQLLAEPPEGLGGSFTLYLSRYMHITVDLALAAPIEIKDPVATDDSAYSFRDSRTLYADSFDSVPPPVRYVIQEHRIVKNGELRYFDHPKFGVLAKVTRVEEVEQENDPDVEAVSDPLPISTIE